MKSLHCLIKRRRVARIELVQRREQGEQNLDNVIIGCPQSFQLVSV